MNVIKKIHLLLFLVSFSSTAQIGDTLQYAREIAYQQKYSEADALLTHYNQNKKDVYGLWLQAQILFWMGNYERSSNFYRQAYNLSPDLAELKLDYGSTLFKMGDVKGSGDILEAYLQGDPSNADALIMLAYIDYWKGKTNRAIKAAQQVLEIHPEHQMAAELMKEINYATALNLNLSAEFVSDDQPLNGQYYVLTAKKYFSNNFSPSLNLKHKNFNLPSISIQSVQLEIGNKIRFGINGPEVSLSGGIIKPHQGKDTIELIGRVAISQKLVKYLSAKISTAQLPYQYTLASIETPLMHQLSSVALSLNNPKSIIGKLAYERQDFPDDNIIHTSYLYLLKSIIKSGSFRLDLGYSLNYAHSEKNTFQPAEEGISRPGQALSNYITGVYDPYFSPQNQLVNSAFGSVKINPTDAFEIKMRANFGFYAKAEQPFFFTSQNTGNRFTTEKSFYEEQYTPVELFVGLALNVTRQIQIKADYQYSKLLFYELQNIGLSANYNF